MHFSTVIHRAVHVLSEPDPNPKEREVAAATLVASAEEDIAPTGTAAALWQYITTNPNGAYVTRCADVIGRSLPFDSVVHAAAVKVLSSTESDPEIFEAALSLVTGKPYAAHVTAEVLLAISECSLRKGRRSALFIPQLIEVVHDVSGGLPVSILRALRDGWTRSKDEDQRVEAPEIGKLVPEMDVVWLSELLRDPSAKVRRAVAQTIYRLPSPEEALVVIEDRIERETHAEVLSALHDAKADIARELQRQARRVR